MTAQVESIESTQNGDLSNQEAGLNQQKPNESPPGYLSGADGLVGQHKTQPFDAIYPLFFFLVNLLRNMAGSVASYVQSWDLQLLCSASVVIGNNFVKEAFSDLCPEISSSKLVASSALLLLSGCKTASWTLLIQASLCDRMSTRAWKPD